MVIALPEIRMRCRLILLLLLALPSSLVADDVYLKNGRAFEDVEAEVADGRVIVYLEFGEIGFSLDAVERIEESVSSQALYRQRRDELGSDPAAEAADWLELARWALERGLAPRAREAALPAAEAAPGSESLFKAQEEQYERARAITHTQRGLGLGFSGGLPGSAAAAAPSGESGKPPGYVKKI